MTEFGISEASGDGLFNWDSISVWMDWMEENKLSWCNWSVADLSESSAALNAFNDNGRWYQDELSESGQYIRSQIRSLNAESSTQQTILPLTLSMFKIN